MALSRLDELESKSVFIIREAYYQFSNLALLWSIGKDSTALLWLCRKAFLGRVPFPSVHIDTGYKFPEMYEFRDEYAKKFGLNLIVGKNEKALAEGMGPNSSKDKLSCCNALKTEALKQTIEKEGVDALLLGRRRDEHDIRAKERVVSPRDENFKWDYQNQPAELWDHYKNSYEKGSHTSVRAMLHWTEADIWEYTRRENIPVSPLYYARDGKRYRSLGCHTCCLPVESNASNIDEVIAELATTTETERSGRAQDKESAYTMQKLRAMGYM